MSETVQQNEALNTGKSKKIKIFLLSSSAVLVAALVICALIFLSGGTQIERVISDNTVARGVSINGIDISGLTPDQARAVTSSVHQELLGAYEFSFDVAGEIHTYPLEKLNVTTDYESVIERALAFARTGSFDKRLEEYNAAREEGVEFTVKLSVAEEDLRLGLANLKKELDKEPQDATATFAPWGYSLAADGTPLKYEPDLKELADANARGNHLDRPELVRLSDEEMPSPLRYLFWNEDHYEEDYIPEDANIARFWYTEEVVGIEADTEAVFDDVMNAVSKVDFSTITIPAVKTEPEIKLEDIKKCTQLISSWTSSYREHSSRNRNWNVSRMSSAFNAMVEPGEEWSANTAAGPRTSSTARTVGWKKAAGLESGGSTQQYGGGVCQLGSTAYNALIRSGVTIVEKSPHSIPSSYIPVGLDATLNTGRQDLIFRNDNTMPIYLVSYVDPVKETVTVEVYGQLPVDPTYGENIIYHFTPGSRSRYGTPGTRNVVGEPGVPLEAPDGTIVDANNPVYEFSRPRTGTSVRVYKHILSAEDGTELCDRIYYETVKYPVINGVTYHYTPVSAGEPGDTGDTGGTGETGGETGDTGDVGETGGTGETTGDAG